jgi:hypothetical protein
VGMVMHVDKAVRRRLSSAALAVALVAIAVAVPACTGKGPAPSACAPKRTGVTAPVAAPSGGAGLRVIEQGFTQLGQASGAGAMVSLGAVVENTSTLVAYRTRIRFTVFDAQHVSAVPEKSGELLYQEIPVILPGQKIAVGSWTYTREGERSTNVVVAGFDVELGTPQWWPRANDVYPFASVATQPVTVQRDTIDTRKAWVDYTAVSQYCGTIALRGVAVVFRDSGGTLIGGSFDSRGSGAQCPKRAVSVPGTIDSVAPPNLDPNRTEITLYCDPVPPITSSGPRASGEPIN